MTAPITSKRKLLCVLLQPLSVGLEERLHNHGWDLTSARSMKAASQLLARQHFHVALLALDRPTPAFLAEFEDCAATSVACEWVGLLAPGAMQLPGMRELILRHFFDFHTEPADAHFLCQSLGHAFGKAMLRADVGFPAAGRDDLGMVGSSAVVACLRRLIMKAGPIDAPVLIGGESGSGKELVARALHRASPRAGAPFVAINLGSLAPTLVHSELFGHERGAFSGASAERRGLIEAARGGTLFLDEIAELPLELQATLLRFLEEKTIHRVGGTRPLAADTRVIAASHVDLAQAVAGGRFREDLYYRLNVLPIAVPPLRERREDIPLLAQHFYERCASERSSDVAGFSRIAMTALMLHHWPGNVRELNNRVQRAFLMAEQRMIAPRDLGLGEAAGPEGDKLQTVRVQAEKSAIRLSLSRLSQNVTLAARELGISRMTLYRLMAKHRITPRTE